MHAASTANQATSGLQRFIRTEVVDDGLASSLQVDPKSNLTDSMVTLVMFDSNYQDLWRCWMDYWQKSGTKQQLDVVVYDKIAEAVVNSWQGDHPGVKMNAHTVHSDYEKLVNKKKEFVVASEQFDRELFLRDGMHLGSSTRWDSPVYEVNFWKQIKERLNDGKDVLHMDVDAIPVGNPWDPVDRMLGAVPDADIIVSGQSCTLCGIQYMFFRNTKAAHEVVDYHLKEWDDYFSRGEITPAELRTETQCPPADPRNHRPCEPQLAFGKYQEKFGCDDSQLQRTRHADCKTHTHRKLRIAVASGIGQNSKCSADECKQKGLSVDHGRSFLNFYCPNYDMNKAQGDIMKEMRH